MTNPYADTAEKLTEIRYWAEGTELDVVTDFVGAFEDPATRTLTVEDVVSVVAEVAQRRREAIARVGGDDPAGVLPRLRERRARLGLRRPGAPELPDVGRHPYGVGAAAPDPATLRLVGPEGCDRCATGPGPGRVHAAWCERR